MGDWGAGKAWEGWKDYAGAVVGRARGLLIGTDAATDVEARSEAHRLALERSRGEDFRDLEDLRFCIVQRARCGWVMVFHGNRIPMATVDRERVYRYVIRQHDELLRDQNFTVLYVQTGASYEENSPGLVWLGEKLGAVDEVILRSVSRLIILHPDWHLWSCCQILGSGLLHSLWAKTAFFLRVELLPGDVFGENGVDLPEAVMDHDRELEGNVLSDFYVDGGTLSKAAEPQ
ncbi:CRAL-TRIO domain-containing protein [Chloropicon roscoffensis]|uniref:CRAL-TRIO domain-containing protein n=1 Tax=Chloropicon roscoffensis TaxID=1461544 RepID=A0AAX4PKJ8_9CHLO